MNQHREDNMDIQIGKTFPIHTDLSPTEYDCVLSAAVLPWGWKSQLGYEVERTPNGTLFERGEKQRGGLFRRWKRLTVWKYTPTEKTYLGKMTLGEFRELL